MHSLGDRFSHSNTILKHPNLTKLEREIVNFAQKMTLDKQTHLQNCKLIYLTESTTSKLDNFSTLDNKLRVCESLSVSLLLFYWKCFYKNACLSVRNNNLFTLLIWNEFKLKVAKVAIRFDGKQIVNLQKRAISKFAQIFRYK